MTKRLNILLIDGNKAGRVITEEILNETNLPFILSHVLSLKDAVSYLCKEKEYFNVEKPDLIVLEAGLLYRDMETWSKQICSDERFKKIPSIALLLFKEEETYFRSHSLSIDCYLVKPIDLIEMDTITIALRKFVESIPLVKDDIYL